MPLRHAIDLDSDSHYATILELREEYRFMRKSETELSPRSNTQEDAVVALIDYHRSLQPPDDAPPPSQTRRRSTP